MLRTSCVLGINASYQNAKNPPQAAFLNAFCPLRVQIPAKLKTKSQHLWYCDFVWSWWRDLNPRPIDYESIALPLRHTSVSNVSVTSDFNIIPHMRAIVKSFCEKSVTKYNAAKAPVYQGFCRLHEKLSVRYPQAQLS